MSNETAHNGAELTHPRTLGTASAALPFSHTRCAIAAPMVVGIFTSCALELVVYPAIYEIWKRRFEMKRAAPNRSPLAALPSREAAP